MNSPAPVTPREVLDKLITLRLGWERNELAVSNQRLYEILQGCYALHWKAVGDPQVQNAIQTVANERNISKRSNTRLALLLIKVVFGEDHNQAWDYSKALSNAEDERVPIQDFVKWIEERGGLYKASRSVPPVAPTATQTAASASSDESPFLPWILNEIKDAPPGVFEGSSPATLEVDLLGQGAPKPGLSSLLVQVFEDGSVVPIGFSSESEATLAQKLQKLPIFERNLSCSFPWMLDVVELIRLPRQSGKPSPDAPSYEAIILADGPSVSGVVRSERNGEGTIRFEADGWAGTLPEGAWRLSAQFANAVHAINASLPFCKWSWEVTGSSRQLLVKPVGGRTYEEWVAVFEKHTGKRFQLPDGAVDGADGLRVPIEPMELASARVLIDKVRAGRISDICSIDEAFLKALGKLPLGPLRIAFKQDVLVAQAASHRANPVPVEIPWSGGSPSKSSLSATPPSSVSGRWIKFAATYLARRNDGSDVMLAASSKVLLLRGTYGRASIEFAVGSA